ncbi:MAG: pyrrolysine--tRNA(Pyl) ligase large subunit [Candidatus Bathyarchaeota archaeon]|nr:MAG: pyrrolysine--tRNA(Pyl) ligase large subunit [Candidatus Bathyarchaeota archaeon]
MEFTETQKKRLKELGADNYIELSFPNVKERDSKFDQLNTSLERKCKADLLNLFKNVKRPLIKQLESKLIKTLVSVGFVEVTTPYIISKDFIYKMGIVETHNLWRQIFWLDDGRCLRPMLAPNLYHVMKCLRKILKPVRIFEIGPCFRKESMGREHIEGFTMLNIVELAPEKDPFQRLKEIINIVLDAVKLPSYVLNKVEAEVYGETIDILIDQNEIASAAIGPHPLDENWGIFDAWAGVGFGIERIAMVKKGVNRIKQVSRSLTSLDGICLDIQ